MEILDIACCGLASFKLGLPKWLLQSNFRNVLMKKGLNTKLQWFLSGIAKSANPIAFTSCTASLAVLLQQNGWWRCLYENTRLTGACDYLDTYQAELRS